MSLRCAVETLGNSAEGWVLSVTPVTHESEERLNVVMPRGQRRLQGTSGLGRNGRADLKVTLRSSFPSSASCSFCRGVL